MVESPPTFRPIALRVLTERYLRRDPEGRVVETPDELFRRVAQGVAGAEERYGGSEAAARQAGAFYEAMASRQFLPNTPTLTNAGLPRGQLAACFVIPIADDMRSILEGVRDMALIHQTGGGTGFNFSHLRPRGDQVRSTGRVASGPVGFMRIFDTTTAVVKQGGRRRGANMGILRVDHPDILEFITAKRGTGDARPTSTCPWPSPTTSCSGWPDDAYPLINPRTAAHGSGSRPGRCSTSSVAGPDHGRPGPGLCRCHGAGQPHPGDRAPGGHQPLRRAAPPGLRGLQPGLHQPGRPGQPG